MIISDEQALLAAQYLSSHQSGDASIYSAVPQDVLAAALAAAEDAPDTRADRVSEARAYLGDGPIDSRDVASKMISRIISDSLR